MIIDKQANRWSTCIPSFIAQFVMWDSTVPHLHTLHRSPITDHRSPPFISLFTHAYIIIYIIINAGFCFEGAAGDLQLHQELAQRGGRSQRSIIGASRIHGQRQRSSRHYQELVNVILLLPTFFSCLGFGHYVRPTYNFFSYLGVIYIYIQHPYL